MWLISLNIIVEILPYSQWQNLACFGKYYPMVYVYLILLFFHKYFLHFLLIRYFISSLRIAYNTFLS